MTFIQIMGGGALHMIPISFFFDERLFVYAVGDDPQTAELRIRFS